MIEIIFEYLKQYEEIESIDEITETNWDTFEFSGFEYQIMTDDDFKIYSDEMIENYIDECILPEIPEQYRNYFDDESFKRDIDYGGDRDLMVATYDGFVDEFKFEDIWYKVWKV